MKTPEISVIVLSFNTKTVLNQCLRELKKAKMFFELETKKSVEVIVLDNDSEDNSVEMVKKNYPWVKLIVSKENLGFSKGNNLAMKQARGENFLLLNSDAFVKKETLCKAWNYLKNHPQTDVVGCKLLYEDGKFQPSGGYLPNPLRTCALMFGIDKLPFLKQLLGPIHPKTKVFFNNNNKLEWIMGAFMFMRREVFEKTGGFDEHFFMYTEEVEWCRRMKEKKIKLAYVPSFSIIHLGAASSSDKSAPIIQEAQGLIKYHKKYFPESVYLIKVAIKLGFLSRWVVFSMLNDARSNAYRKALV